MERAVALLAGAGLGAGLMYLLDPQMGRRRRALARDQAVSLAHEAQDAAGVVARDATNRARGLAAGDLSVLVGGRRALRHPLSGGWSPTARTLMGLAGGGMLLYGLTQDAPVSCVLGSIGLGLAAEGLTNAGLDDVRRGARQVADTAGDVARMATDAAGRAADSISFGREDAGRGRTGQGDAAMHGRAAEPAPAMRG
jgi:hypothetical protein